ncbi:DUF6457 domain-containing protein [Actinotalea sp. K2]|uniref:DUF6457 domain-containing protein n=1 Tax=Actinotalea sp. K2 TaxID=2939438 RepID=UPI00201715CF|nr:DUF6457 domain-containing protein [Actinotalea sp. K2]MCL3860735.1 DUF6457 domain-containing protein [Actinotalea sp. K2]
MAHDETGDDRARWAALITAELGIPASLLDEVSEPVLDLVRDVAHQVNRPSAPLTAFLVGLAAGGAHPRGSQALTAEAVREATARATALVHRWTEPNPS